MKVTVRDTDQPDRVVWTVPILPGLGIPAVGSRLVLKERAHHGGGQKAIVVDVVWRFATKEPSETEVDLLVKFD